MKRLILFVVILLIAVTAFGKEYNQAYEEKLIQDLKGIYTQEAIKTPDNPTGHPICATSMVLQARHDYPFLSLETKKILDTLLARPSLEFYYDSPSAHFRIHYDISGANKVPAVDANVNGISDYVENCAVILDSVWAKEVDDLGYIPPPSDGWYPLFMDNGGDGKYDIYLLNLGSDYLGYAFPETTNSTPPISYTSFFVLDNDYLGYPPYHEQLDWLKVTAAHEFFHAIQFGYDVFEGELAGNTLKPYWMEMSAVWMEDVVFDNINDYIYYLRSFFKAPWLSLRTFRNEEDRHPYGSCVWPIYLGERFGIDIIKDIWTKCAEVPFDNVLSATDQILNDLYGSSLNEAFREFSVWNYFTADRANPELFGFYSEGNLFYDIDGPIKVMETDIHNLYPVTDSSVYQLPENLGANYIAFIPMVDSIGGLRIYFDGDGDGEVSWEVSLIGNRCVDFIPDTTKFEPYPDTVRRSNKCNDFPPEISKIELNPIQQKGMGQIFDWTRFLEVVMVVARGDTNSSNYKYSYTAEFDDSLTTGWVPPSAEKAYQNFPNPFVIRDANSTTKFPLSLKSPSDVKLFIFTTSGELVWEYTWLNRCAGNYDISEFPDPEFLPFQWDGRNMKGEYVASGIYIYRIVTNSTSGTKKLVVVNQR